MSQQLHANWRIALVVALHLLLALFAYKWWLFGPHFRPHGNIPNHDLLTEGTASAICLVLLVPVWLRGNMIQRAIAVTLSLLPAVIFALAVYYGIRICMYIYG
jgi:hypothetical protein